MTVIAGMTATAATTAGGRGSMATAAVAMSGGVAMSAAGMGAPAGTMAVGTTTAAVIGRMAGGSGMAGGMSGGAARRRRWRKGSSRRAQRALPTEALPRRRRWVQVLCTDACDRALLQWAGLHCSGLQYGSPARLMGASRAVVDAH